VIPILYQYLRMVSQLFFRKWFIFSIVLIGRHSLSPLILYKASKLYFWLTTNDLFGNRKIFCACSLIDSTH